MNKIDVFLVDDHKIFRNGLRILFEEITDIRVAGEASNGKEFLETMEQLKRKPQLAFMDISMPVMDGMEATQIAKELYPDLKIIALTTFNDDAYFNKMLDAGVEGFLLKNSDKEDFEKAVYRVMEGGHYFSHELISGLSFKLLHTEKKQEKVILSEREIDVLKLIAQGFSNQEIADALFLSKRTIDGHRARMIAKTEVKNSIELVIYAIKHKIIEI